MRAQCLYCVLVFAGLLLPAARPLPCVGAEGEAMPATRPLGAPPDANGGRWNTWHARRDYRVIFEPAPSLDGVFLDNVFVLPRVQGDWNRDGVIDDRKDAAVQRWNREGLMAYLNQLKALMPGKLITGNIGEWAARAGCGVAIPEYDGQFDGGVLEYFIGETWSAEGRDLRGKVAPWGSWRLMMEQYHDTMARVKEPKLVVFGVKGLPDDYPAFRYAFASCLMNDAYFDLSDGSGSFNNEYASYTWFDEFDLAGTASTAWLGRALDPPQTSPWRKGVYRRRFENGLALVNPRGNGAQTVAMEAGYRRFRGEQDPRTNNSEPATTIALADRDGLLLVRQE